MTDEERKKLYQLLYAAISSRTVASDDNGRLVKTTYQGPLSDLFKDGETPITNSSYVVTRFLWAVSHKTNALPTVLFSIKKSGIKGVIVSRLNSGFYLDETDPTTGKRVHVVGNDLIPYIIASMKEYKVTPRAKSDAPVEPMTAADPDPFAHIHEMNDDELTALAAAIDKEFRSRAERREKQAKLQQVLELAEMSRDELKELLSI